MAGRSTLDELAPNYGADRRRLKIMKYRGQAYRGGYHDFTIVTGGVKVFPRLVAAEHKTSFDVSRVQSGIAELDQLLGGGVDKGSSTLVLGPAGAGKTLFAFQYADAAMRRGEKVAIFMFDEELGVTFRRSKAMGMDLETHRQAGKLVIEQVDAAELSPSEFSQRARRCVDDLGVGMVLIDSLNGYRAAMPEEHSLLLHMHELLQYLAASVPIAVVVPAAVAIVFTPVLCVLRQGRVAVRPHHGRGRRSGCHHRPNHQAHEPDQSALANHVFLPPWWTVGLNASTSTTLELNACPACGSSVVQPRRPHRAPQDRHRAASTQGPS
jgi:KaiC/GvpD/RAD55 family RecA-like ATPase